MKHHRIIVEFTTPELSQQYEQKLYAHAKVIVEEFREAVADILTEAGVEATVVSRGVVSRDN